MNRDKIIEDLEKLQEDVWEHGFAGSNERELWLRESIADYIVKNCSIPNVVNRRELLIAFMESLTTEHLTEIEIAEFDKVADRFLGN